MQSMKKILLIGAIFTIIFMMTGCGSTTIDLNKYITIKVDGYDTVGTATYTFDYEAFHKDYSGKIKVNSKDSDEITALGIQSGETIDELLLDTCVNQQLNQIRNLSNGDVIILTWDCKDDLAEEYFKCKLNYSDIEYTVNGLKEVGTFNPFDYLEVSFSGTAPNGNVVFSQNLDQSEMKYITFNVSKSYGLSNGDVITVTASLSGGDESFIEQFGTVLGEKEKTYEVNSLAYYVTDDKDIPSDVMDGMISQGEDVFRAYVANTWDKPENLINVSYAGNYFLNMKPDMNADIKNYTFLVYNITAVNPEPEETVNFYYYICYNNIVISEDGTCLVDFSTYSKPSSRESFEVGRYTYIGYENLDSLFNECVTTRIDSYEYNSTVQK